MTNPNINTLNDVTKMLIDSQKGYEKAAEVSDDNFAFNAEFSRRAGDRQKLISDFQNQVKTLGGEPQSEGGMLGKLHRAMTDFSAMFQDDTKAALKAIDDGEEQLADHIEKNIKNDELDHNTQLLLRRAHVAAKEGERFADRLDS